MNYYRNRIFYSIVKSDDFARICFCGTGYDSILMTHTSFDSERIELLMVFHEIMISIHPRGNIADVLKMEHIK